MVTSRGISQLTRELSKVINAFRYARRIEFVGSYRNVICNVGHEVAHPRRVKRMCVILVTFAMRPALFFYANSRPLG